MAASGTQTYLISKSRFPQVQPKALIRSLTCLADGTALDKWEWMKSGPKQLAKAEEAIGIPDIQKQFWSPGLRRVNSRSTRKLVMLKLNVYFGPCASWEEACKKCEAEKSLFPAGITAGGQAVWQVILPWHEQGWRGRAGLAVASKHVIAGP